MGLLQKMTVILPAFIIAFLVTLSVIRSDPNTNVMMVMCNPNVYANDDPFTNSLAYVIAELETVTPNRQGYDLRNVSPYPTSLAYGHASCNQNLAASDCTLCLVAAKTTMSSYCNNRIGARSVLTDCLIRFGIIILSQSSFSLISIGRRCNESDLTVSNWVVTLAPFRVIPERLHLLDSWVVPVQDRPNCWKLSIMEMKKCRDKLLNLDNPTSAFHESRAEQSYVTSTVRRVREWWRTSYCKLLVPTEEMVEKVEVLAKEVEERMLDFKLTS
ncbi:hypothetical protein RJ639_043119 [Escallonia herrerae]|uniref:Gnk2-homologous domain-containing protein n=1 Tax=Escallonia herrerae TaxID=1293975 RepID=A0AA88WBV2_9ASTE|nr:hypothetical protein RJ639_043119 [Escallonia herrerae]